METNGSGMAHIVSDEAAFRDDHDGETNERPEQIEHSDFGPLVDRIARGIATELALAVKELDHHISLEARKSGESVERQLAPISEEMARIRTIIGEQRATNHAMEDRWRQLDAGIA